MPSTVSRLVSEFLLRSGGDSLAISCSLPIFFPGTVRLVDAAHAIGIPVIVGGRAFGNDAARATRLGADAWAATAEDAATVLAAWRLNPPTIAREPTPLDPEALRLATMADGLGGAAMTALLDQFPPMAQYDDRQLTRTREDLVFIVQYLAAAILASDPSVFTEFLHWLQDLLAHRHVPPQALIMGLEALHPLIGEVDENAASLLDSGHNELAHGLR